MSSVGKNGASEEMSADRGKWTDDMLCRPHIMWDKGKKKIHKRTEAILQEEYYGCGWIGIGVEVGQRK